MSRLQATARLFINLASFAVARGATFLAPVALAAALPTEDYGQFEAILAYAMVAAVILNFGTSAALPYFTLEIPNPERIRQIYQHLLLLIFTLSILSIFCFGAGSPAAPVLGLALIAHICAQRIMSAQFMTDRSSQKASFAGGYVYILLLLAAAGSWAGYNLTLTILTVVLLCGLLPILIWGWRKVFISADHRLDINRLASQLADFNGYPEVLKFAAPTLMLGMGILGIVSLVRLIALPLVGAERLAEYAIIFRLAGVAVVLYQFLAILSFRHVYQSDPEVADRQLSIIALLCIVLAMGEYLALPLLPRDWLPLPQISNPLHHYGLTEAVFVMICGWIAMTLTENLLYRYAMAMRAFVADAAIFTIGLLTIAIIWRSRTSLEIEDLAATHATIVCAIAVSHCVTLWRGGIRYHKLLLISAALFFIALLGQLTNAGSPR